MWASAARKGKIPSGLQARISAENFLHGFRLSEVRKKGSAFLRRGVYSTRSSWLKWNDQISRPAASFPIERASSFLYSRS